MFQNGKGDPSALMAQMANSINNENFSHMAMGSPSNDNEEGAQNFSNRMIDIQEMQKQ